MMMSFTREFTTAPSATPMITANANASTFCLISHARKPLMGKPSYTVGVGGERSTTTARQPSVTRLTATRRARYALSTLGGRVLMDQIASLRTLGERQREILRAVIREYIGSAQPVASATLVRRYRLEVSPASVRNELAALEELGLLTHPHTSAGRVPTDLGYRYFIESLMPRPSLHPEEQLTVSHQFQQALSNTSEWLRLAASTLARLTTEAAIVTPPATGRATMPHVEVVPISERRALVVVVFDGGAVAQQLLELRVATTPEHLRALSTRLTETLDRKSTRLNSSH